MIWSSSEETLLNLVGAEWNERFRKVQIHFTYHSKEDDEYRRMLDFGERRARELVGGAFVATLGGETKTVDR